MRLRVLALVLGIIAGFVFGWARLTDPDTFHRMLGLRSATVYLLMGGAVAVAFVGARLVRGRRAPLSGERIDWRPSRPSRSHVAGGVLFGIGWAISDACPGPAAAQLGGGRVVAVALAAGIVTGVKLQPSLAALMERMRRTSDDAVPTVPAADVL
jgi:uncharacterized membrane protein YedE/YeeE